jgi:hypothetical protein
MPRLSVIAAAAFLFAAPANAHINLVSPAPLMDGHAFEETALKAAPFGAPGVEIADAAATTFEAGQEIDLVLDIYKIHPGEIVVSYTRDVEGEDVFPVYNLPSVKTAIPHVNALLQVASPCSAEVGCATAAPGVMSHHLKVKLPDTTGDIILVVRQVMRDKVYVADDGRVDLSEAYYHQASKLHLVAARERRQAD